MSAGSESEDRLTSVYDSVRFIICSTDPSIILCQSNSRTEAQKVPVRRSRWYPEVGKSSAVPDITRIKPSIDDWNLQYKPTTRWTPTSDDI